MNSTNLHPEQQAFVKLLTEFNDKYESRKVFLDFLELALIALHQPFHVFHKGEIDDELEKQYLRIISHYSQEDAEKIPKLLALVVKGLGGGNKLHFQDFLGPIWEHLGFTDTKKGQFFTPEPVAKMMATITFDATPIKEKGFITCSDPTCGSGILLIGYAEALQNNGFNPQTQLFVVGIDISFPAVCMSYIQTTLLGIPAQIIQGDSLANEAYSTWSNIHLAMNWWRFKPKTAKPVEPTVEKLVEKPVTKGKIAFGFSL